MTAEAAKSRSIIRRMYDWCMDAAAKPHAFWTLGIVSFAESSFFPVPPDIMLVPMASSLFQAAGIPRRLMPAAIVLGTSTFTMSALPGGVPTVMVICLPA